MPSPPTITVSMHETDIALLSFDMPGKGANILSRSVLDEFSTHLDKLQKRDDLAGLVIASGKPGTFIAGADLREFAASLDVPREEVVAICRRGQSLFARLAECPFVTVAAIDGLCLGGGAELAVWCDRRVLSDQPKTEIGFPEVKLGLFPGWGGTARAPRMIGLSNAVEMITGGDSVDAWAAAAMGLADDVVAVDRLLAASIDMVRSEQVSGRYREDRKQWSRPLTISDTELGFLGATASALIREKTKGQYPAPQAALEVMLEAAGSDLDAACLLEAQRMSGLFGSPVNRALLNVFFLQERLKKDTGLSGDGIQPGKLETVGIVGAGLMGSGIAAATIKNGLPVILSDAAPDALARGLRNALEEASYNRKLGGTDAARAMELSPLLNVRFADEDLARCDLMLEAVVENAEVKQALYAKIEPRLRPDAVLASNTSTIPITRLAAKLKHPERFCGIHFFNPVRRMKLVEVIRGEKTSDATVVTAVAYAKRIGKLPIVVNDSPGFLVNRLLMQYMNEAQELLCEGVSIRDVDKAATAFGMPVGPILLYDMVGLDTALFAGRTMWEAFPKHVVASPVLPALVKAGRLGQKSGAGFFSYDNPKRQPEPDPKVDAIIAQYHRDNGGATREQITHRLFLPMLLEATRLLEEKIVRDVRDIDFGLIFGLGFPPFQGGLLFWADTIGAAKVVEMLKPFEHLGMRFQPTDYLLEMAKEGRRFYP